MPMYDPNDDVELVMSIGTYEECLDKLDHVHERLKEYFNSEHPAMDNELPELKNIIDTLKEARAYG